MAAKKGLIARVLDYIFTPPELEKPVTFVIRNEDPPEQWPPVLEVAAEIMPTMIQARGPMTPNRVATMCLDYAEELFREFEKRKERYAD